MTGRVGLRQVDQGNYVQTSDTAGLVVMTQLQPISVIFTLPEDSLPAVIAAMHGPAPLPVTALDRANTTQIGQRHAADAGQPGGHHHGHGQGAGAVSEWRRVAVSQPVRQRQSAGADAARRGADAQRRHPARRAGHVRLRHRGDNKVSVRPIKLGPTDGDLSEVTDGLKAGERVVIDGADRLKDGAAL